MRRLTLIAALAMMAISAKAQTTLAISPTTTLAAETGNNTSAAPTFTTQANGNIGGANISKIDTHTLLYPGFSGKIYAHIEPWWGSSSHINIGYSSQDTAQVQRQISDINGRGIDGAVVDWYGPGSYEDGTVKTLFSQAELSSRFSIIVEIDVGAVNWHSCYPTCSATTAAVNLFTTMGNTFFASPAYARVSGRPMAMEFGFETLSLPAGAPAGWNVVDWNAVQTQVPGNMALYHRNLGGFGKAQSAGAFGWMEPKTLDVEPANYDGTDELNWFYGQSYTTNAAKTVGALWKGFNDILADWAPAGGRHIEQNCGQTWLNTFAYANQYYSSSNQLQAVQLVTWNDYEEGSEIESGIDNCVSLAAAISGTKLTWSISGQENTVDHYKVFISTDGQNLMPLTDMSVGTRALDLSTYGLGAGAYTLYVKAIGKPSLTNKMSNAVQYTAAPTASPATLSVTPSTGMAPLAVTATATAPTSTAAASTNPSSTSSIDFGDGTVVSGTSGSHTYATPGTYTVLANVSGSTATSTVTASPQSPIAQLALSSSSATTATAITASTANSTDPNAGGSISNSIVDWGDGASSAGPSASHSYAAAGTYTVTATVTDNYGASSTATQTVTITAPIVSSVTISTPQNGSTVNGPQVHVLASASSPNGVASMILYVDYNQVGPTLTSANLDTYISLTPGSHLLAVNSWDKLGNLIQSTSSNITVAAVAPTASLTLSATTATAPATITANVTSNDSNVGGSISSATINWGDGSNSTGSSASHTYSSAGTYSVIATVTDNYGKSATSASTLTVSAPVVVAPTAAMSVSMNGATATVSTGASTAGSGTITSTVINWGDGTSTTGATASHTYIKGGYDTITVTVTNSYGKTASTSQQVTAAGVVIWLPQPGATAAQPVHIAATAYDSKTIASMIVYLDGNQVYLGYVNDFDVWVSMHSGTHTIVVKAWEAGTGVVYQSSVKFKAQ